MSGANPENDTQMVKGFSAIPKKAIRAMSGIPTSLMRVTQGPGMMSPEEFRGKLSLPNQVPAQPPVANSGGGVATQALPVGGGVPTHVIAQFLNPSRSYKGK